MNNRYMRQMNDYLEGGQGSAPRQNGAFANMVPRQTMIRDQPHMLAYINPTEEQMLRDMGGSGMPGPDGVPAYDHNWLHSGAQKVGGAISSGVDYVKDAYDFITNDNDLFANIGGDAVVNNNTTNGATNDDTTAATGATAAPLPTTAAATSELMTPAQVTAYENLQSGNYGSGIDADWPKYYDDGGMELGAGTTSLYEATIAANQNESAAFQPNYQTDANGQVFYYDADGSKQTVGGDNWGQDNPSQALTAYLDSEPQYFDVYEELEKTDQDYDPTDPFETGESDSSEVFVDPREVRTLEVGRQFYVDADGNFDGFTGGDISIPTLSANKNSATEFYETVNSATPIGAETAATGADAGALTNVGTDIPTFANYYEAIDAGWLGKEVIINGQNVIAETADGYTGTGEVTTGTDTGTGVANTDARAEAGLDPIATASVNLETGQIEGSTLNLTDAEINQLNQEKQAWDNNSYFEGDASTKGFYETIFGTKFQDTFAGGLIGVTEDGLFGSEGAADKLYLSGVDLIDGGGQGLAGVEFGAGDNTALDLNKNGYLDADEMARGRDFYKNNLISNYSNAIDASTYNEDAGLFGTGGLYDVLSDFTDPLTIAGNIATDGVGVGQTILNKTGLDEMLAGTVTGNLLGIDGNATGFEAVNVDPEFINTVVAKVLAEDPLSGYNLVTDENGVTTFTGPDGEKIDLSQITNNENITNEYTTNVTNVTNEAASLPIETKILTEERPIDQVFERLKRYNSGYLPAYMQKWLTDNSIDELVRKIVGEDGETYYITPDGRYLTADQFENTINVGSKSFATGSETVETGYTVLDTNTGILETYDTEDNLISTTGPDTSETEEAA